MQRNKALDIFRGMTVCLMIIVNTPGTWSTVFAPLKHANWHGFTPTDWVFPSFLFAVGTAFAFVKNRWADKRFADVAGKIIKRTLIIFVLGYLMYWFPFLKWSGEGELMGFPIGDTRIWGVLQRIALCYFLAAILVFYLNKKQLIYASAVLLIGYWAVLWGFGDYTLEGNAVRHLDIFLFGENHLYKGDGIPFDPEGFLSTFPAIVNVIGGYLCGAYIIANQQKGFRMIAMLMMVGAGLASLSYFWDLVFPINKKLWTSSYVLLTVGLNLVFMGILTYFTDLREKTVNLKFFDVFGKNPLFIYLLSEYLAITLLFLRIDGKSVYGHIFEKGFSWMGGYLGSFVFALVFMLLCWAAGWWLDKRRIYIRV
jgi:predicted acyltransferase